MENKDTKPPAGTYPPPLSPDLWGTDTWTGPSPAFGVRSITRFAGRRSPEPAASYHDYWELTFSFTGTGTVEIESKCYAIHGPAAWLIPPHALHRELTDDPHWDMLWIGLTGGQLEALPGEPAILYAAEDLLPLADELWLWQRKHQGRIGPEMDTLAAVLCRAVVRKAENSTPSESSDWLQRTLEYIHANLGEPLELEDLAAASGYSVGHFQRSFKARMGTTPWQYVTDQRPDLALIYLRESRHSIGEIAGLTGYRDQLYFSRAFRKHYGCSPSEWRAAHVNHLPH